MDGVWWEWYLQHFSAFAEHSKCFLIISPIHKPVSTPKSCFKTCLSHFIECFAGKLGFSILTTDTLTCTLEKLRIEPLTFWLVDNLLCLLYHSCPEYHFSNSHHHKTCNAIRVFFVHNSVSVSLQNEKRSEAKSYEVHTEIHIFAFL